MRSTQQFPPHQVSFKRGFTDPHVNPNHASIIVSHMTKSILAISSCNHHIANVCVWTCYLSNISVVGSCYISGDPMSYTGNLAVAEDGSACLAWTATSNVHYDSEFPDGSVTAASNFCRNPDMLEKPYCYVNVDRTVENCNVAACNSHGKEATGPLFHNFFRKYQYSSAYPLMRLRKFYTMPT